MSLRQADVADALETLILGPFVAFAIGILFLMVSRMYLIFGPKIETHLSLTPTKHSVLHSLSGSLEH